MTETSDTTATEKSYTAMKEKSNTATTETSDTSPAETSITVTPGISNTAPIEPKVAVEVGAGGLKAGGLKAGDIIEPFAGIPIEHLICDPIIAVARGQQALCEVYLDNIFKLAYKDGKKGGETNILEFNLNRLVTDPKDGSIKTQAIKINAPLLSLVPVPAFTMDAIEVRFTMEVKEHIIDKASVVAKASVDITGGVWAYKAVIHGEVTTDISHTRDSDQTAKYEIVAKAIQHPPAEGMAKLTSLFASTMEPIPTTTK